MNPEGQRKECKKVRQTIRKVAGNDWLNWDSCCVTVSAEAALISG
jgi:hypothetical protein